MAETFDSSIPTIEPYTIENVPDNNSSYQPYNPESDLSVNESSTPNTRNNMIRVGVIVLIIIATLVVVLLLVGGGAEEAPAPGQAVDPGSNSNDNSVILVWSGVFLAEEVVQPLIDEYESLRPNVTINYSNQWPLGEDFEAASVEYRDNLKSFFEVPDGQSRNLNAPDIFMINNQWVQDFLVEAQAAPPNIITETDIQNEFFPVVYDDFVVQQNVYGLPMWMDVLAIVYNRDLVVTPDNPTGEIPNDWTELRNFAVGISDFTDDEPFAGFPAGISSNVDFSYELFLQLLFQNGVSITDASGLPTFADADVIDDTQGAFQFFKSFINSRKTWDSIYQNDSAALAESSAAMVVAPSWRYRDILATNDTLGLGLNLDVAPMPSIGGSVPSTSATYWGNMVYDRSLHTTEAWAFTTWLSLPEQQITLNESFKQYIEASGQLFYFGLLPGRVESISEFVDANGAFSTQIDFLDVYINSLAQAQSWQAPRGVESRILFESVLDEPEVSRSDIISLQENLLVIWNEIVTERTSEGF